MVTHALFWLRSYAERCPGWYGWRQRVARDRRFLALIADHRATAEAEGYGVTRTALRERRV